MIKSVTVTNHLGESLKLEMRRPETSGFYIKKIDGLGPSKANINITERATMDGGQFHSSHVNSRNIVIELGFMFTHNIEQVRHRSYKYFPIKKRVNLVFETDTRTCETYGYVESNEPNIFDKDEGAQISIICPDSYFYSAGAQANSITEFSNVDSMFEFPFSNESLTENLIVFGNIRHDNAQTIVYTGEADVGIDIRIHAVGVASNVVIANTSTNEVMSIDTTKLKELTGEEIIDGDDIYICTVKGKKTIQLLRDGAYTNILNCLGKDADWLQLTTGINEFVYAAESGSDNLQFTIANKIAYEGV